MPHDCDYQASEIETKVERFRALVAAHDLTYAYTDDFRVYNKGKAERAEIDALMRELPYETARRIWNDNVDAKMADGWRAGFYWREAA